VRTEIVAGKRAVMEAVRAGGADEVLVARGTRGSPAMRDVVAAARKEATDVSAELGARSDKARRVHASYTAFRERTAPWSRISLRAVLEAREG